VEGSRERLGVEAIDLYQIHWPVPDEEIEEGWSTLAELKERGVVRPEQVDPIVAPRSCGGSETAGVGRGSALHAFSDLRR
jgi:hypothetical protein